MRVVSKLACVLPAILLLSSGLVAKRKAVSGPGSGHFEPPVLQMPPDRKILHALNRLTFGPRPGDTEAVAAEGLRQVHVLLVAGEAVEEKNGWVRLSACGEEKDAHDLAAVRGEDGFLVLGGDFGVGRRVVGDGARLLGAEWAEGKKEAGDDECS